MSTMEKFENQKNPQIPTVTIRKNGTICINTKGVDQFNLEGMRSATLYHDPKESTMGIKLTKDEKDPTAFRISKEKGRASTISCRAFLKYIGIPYKKGSKIYPADWDEKGGMILVRLG